MKRDIGMTLVNLFGTKVSDFSRSCVALGRLLKKMKKRKNNYDDENSRFAYERFLVWREEGTYGPIRHSYG